MRKTNRVERKEMPGLKEHEQVYAVTFGRKFVHSSGVIRRAGETACGLHVYWREDVRKAIARVLKLSPDELASGYDLLAELWQETKKAVLNNDGCYFRALADAIGRFENPLDPVGYACCVLRTANPPPTAKQIQQFIQDRFQFRPDDKTVRRRAAELGIKLAKAKPGPRKGSR